MKEQKLAEAIILGFAVGDALGVPFEFLKEILYQGWALMAFDVKR